MKASERWDAHTCGEIFSQPAQQNYDSSLAPVPPFLSSSDLGSAPLISNVDLIQNRWIRRQLLDISAYVRQKKKKNKHWGGNQSDLLAVGVSFKHKLLRACLVCRFWLPVSSSRSFCPSVWESRSRQGEKWHQADARQDKRSDEKKDKQRVCLRVSPKWLLFSGD